MYTISDENLSLASLRNSYLFLHIVMSQLFIQLVYSKVRGPGTVGLDASATPSEVLTTALEALDYYGVYSISREYDPEYVAPLPAPVPQPEQAQAQSHTPAVGQGQRSPLSERSSSSTTGASTGTAKKARNSRRSSIGISGKKYVLSENPLGEFSPENDNPQMFPELPEEMIASRRVSMGVYGMFTKL